MFPLLALAYLMIVYGLLGIAANVVKRINERDCRKGMHSLWIARRDKQEQIDAEIITYRCSRCGGVKRIMEGGGIIHRPKNWNRGLDFH